MPPPAATWCYDTWKAAQEDVHNILSDVEGALRELRGRVDRDHALMLQQAIKTVATRPNRPAMPRAAVKGTPHAGDLEACYAGLDRLAYTVLRSLDARGQAVPLHVLIEAAVAAEKIARALRMVTIAIADHHVRQQADQARAGRIGTAQGGAR